MDRFFNMDNKFFTFMSRVADLIILNLLCLILCIPIVTIGPSLTALHYMTMKMVKNEETYIVRGFFKSFRQNLKQGIIINLIMLAGAALLYMDFTIAGSMSGNTGRIMFCLLGFIVLLYAMVFIYIYPILAKFYNSVKNTFMNALLMSIRHLPYTLLMIAVTAFPFVGFFFGSGQVPSFILLFGIMFGISGIAYINAHFLVRILNQYIPEDQKAENDQITTDLDFRAAVGDENEETDPTESE